MKGFIKFVFSLALLAAGIVSAMAAVDYMLAKDRRKPLFAKKVATLSKTGENVSLYDGICYTVAVTNEKDEPAKPAE